MPSVLRLRVKEGYHADVLPGGQSAPQPISVDLRPPLSSILPLLAGTALSLAAHPHNLSSQQCAVTSDANINSTFALFSAVLSTLLTVGVELCGNAHNLDLDLV